MNIRPLHVLALCLALLIHTSFSGMVNSEIGQLGEEKVGKVTIRELEVEHKETSTTQSTPDSTNEVSSSSSESNSQEHSFNKNSESSESSEDSSSEETLQRRKVHKRSLDLKQDPINAIGERFNQSSTKEKSGFEKDETYPLETVISNTDSSEPSISATTNTSLVGKDSTDELFSESTTLVTNSTYSGISETTTESRLETTTVPEPETTESETTTEVESEATTVTTPDTITEPESESTTNSDAFTSITETSEDTNSSSDDSVKEIPSSVSSTPSTEIQSQTSEDNPSSFMEVARARVNKLSDQIRLVLVHYRKDGVVVLPGQNFFPEPMPMQDFQKSFSIGTMNFKDMKVFGLSNFTVQHINTDVDRMQVYILLHMKRLVILGNYTLRTFFSRASGPFNVTLLDVDSEGVAEVETAAEGHLEATDSVMDMFTQDMRVDFKNLGFMGSMFQGMVSAVGDALFNSIKPQILERVNLVIRTDVNKKLKEFSTKFINKISPVDLAFSEGRKYAKDHGYDPYNIRDHTFIVGGLVYVNITQFWVEGLSKFYRVGNLSLSMDAGVIQIGVHVMTHKLTGYCTWSGQTFGIVKTGKTNFTIDHLQVRALVNQSLDIRKKPQLEDLDLELGWIKVTMDSPMTLSLMIEGIINAFPRLIRHIIVDTLEQPLKETIQEILDKINIETIVDDNLPHLDSFGL